MSSDDQLNRLERIAALKDKGILTEEEFQKQKDDILRPLPPRAEVHATGITKSGGAGWKVLALSAVAILVLLLLVIISVPPSDDAVSEGEIEAVANDISPDEVVATEGGGSGAEAGTVRDAPIVEAQQAEPGQPRADFTQEELALITQFRDAESDCRGSDDEAKSERGCANRTPLLDALNKRGICWGRNSEVEAEYAVHRCGPDSIR